MVKWCYKKKTERGVPHMLAPRRGCLDYSNVYCDVRKRWFLAWNQNRHITYYILHIQYTNPEISIRLLYPQYVCWHSTRIRQPFWRHYGLRISRAAGFRSFPFPPCFVLLTHLAWHGRSCWTTSKILSSSFKKETSVSNKN